MSINGNSIVSEKDSISLLSLFSSSRAVWKDIVDECYENFKNTEMFVAKYTGNDWDGYFYNFYSQDSDSPGKIQFVGEDGCMKITDDEIILLAGPSEEEKLNNLIKKGKDIKKFGTDMLIMTVAFDIENKTCHTEDILNFKFKIRKKFKNKLINGIRIEKWMILHSFTPGKKSLNALNFVKNNCTIFDVI